jgi:molybdopterin-guanine dinucleotide biosynthesis protein A
MGEDKALLPFGEYNTLTEYQYSRLSKIFSNVYIACNTKEKFSFKAQFIEDNNQTDISAPTFAFISTFERLQVEKVFVISVDSPFIDKRVIQTLVANDSSQYDVTVAKTEFGVQPLCGIYHRSLKNEFIKMKENNSHKLGYLLKNSATKTIFFENANPFLNLNNPHEYKQALQLIE